MTFSEFFRLIFTPGNFEPHFVHFYEEPELMWFIIIGNALVAFAYLLIPLVIIYFVGNRKDLAFRWVFLLFGFFIFFCALTHIIHILIFWYPVYWLQAIVDGTTGLISMATALALIPVIPLALQLRSPKELQILNTQLETLNQSQSSKFEAIINSTDDAIISISSQGIIDTWNRGAEKIYGYTHNEVIGKDISFIWGNDKNELERIKRILATGESIRQLEAERKSNEGYILYLSLTISPIYNANKKVQGFSIITRDITERKLSEMRKDEFLRMASHELKTPVTSLKGYTQVLQAQFEQTQDMESAVYMGKIDQQVNRITRLVDDLLSISRMQAGEYEFNMQQFDIAQLIEEVVESFIVTSGTHKIDVMNVGVCEVRADRGRIEQVLSNLISNAVKYSPKGSTITLRMEKNGSEVTVYVKDQGIGIAEKDKEKIFNKFYRITNDHRDRYSGMGIGLYIASEIIKHHKGTIGVESSLGKGSQFYFTLSHV